MTHIGWRLFFRLRWGVLILRLGLDLFDFFFELLMTRFKFLLHLFYLGSCFTFDELLAGIINRLLSLFVIPAVHFLDNGIELVVQFVSSLRKHVKHFKPILDGLRHVQNGFNHLLFHFLLIRVELLKIHVRRIMVN